MDTTTPPSDSLDLIWANVGLGLAFILFIFLVSTALNLGTRSALLTSAFRCIKAVTNKSKRRFDDMFLLVLVSMLGSTISVSIIGARCALSMDLFWMSNQYIPLVGMLCGSVVSGVVVTVSYVLKEIFDNQDKIETYLAFGASRFEACSQIAREALRLALTPTINSMSIISMIFIPGMITGTVLGDSSVERAVKLQMVIEFMVLASIALASIMTTIVMLSVVVDSEHRVRPDRIKVGGHVVWHMGNWAYGQIIGRVNGVCAWYCYRG